MLSRDASARIIDAPIPKSFDARTKIPTPEAANEWIKIAVALTRPDFEMTCEDFATVLQHFKRAQMYGAKFDPCFVALMLVLERQMHDTAADADADGTDNGIDMDESEDDRGALSGWRDRSNGQVK